MSSPVRSVSPAAASGNFNYPTAIKVGAGRSGELPQLCQDYGISAPLVVCDPGLAALPLLTQLLHKLEQAGLKAALFTKLRPNPVEANIEEGVTAFRAGQHDGVVAIGGGSALDVGKLIAFMQGQTRSLFDFEDIGDWWKRADPQRIAPIIAIPTTAGTGSEVGRAGVVTHLPSHEKKIIFHPQMMPKVAILDPTLTVGLPPKLTAATGMDALSHNLEAYCAPFYHPLAKGVALEGMRLVQEFLPRAVFNGADLEARGQMLVASMMGATAFQGGLGAMHALAHPLGGLYDAHHGMLNGIIMPYVLEANRPVIAPAIDRAAAYLKLGNFEGFLAWIYGLRAQIGIPNRLMDIGIDTARVKEIAALAVKDPSAAGNPIAFSQADYEALALRCIQG
jgi:alcohol dehydrogenase